MRLYIIRVEFQIGNFSKSAGNWNLGYAIRKLAHFAHACTCKRGTSCRRPWRVRGKIICTMPLTFTSQPVSSHYTEKPGRQVRRSMMLRRRPRRACHARSTLPVIPDALVRITRLPDFSRLFVRNVLLDRARALITSRRDPADPGSHYDTGAIRRITEDC